MDYANARRWGCGSDAEGRLNETSDRWRASFHGGERRRRAILWMLKDVISILWIESSERIAHASTAASAITSQSIIVSNPASHHHSQTSPSALAREFRQVSACDHALLEREYTFLGTYISTFSSTKLCGMPAGEVCTSISKFQRAAMNTGVESVRKPMRWICIFLGSGTCS